MFSKWAAKITPDNLTTLIEYGARFGHDLGHIQEVMELNATLGEETWLMVFNPENPESTNFDLIAGSEFEMMYIRIPIYHPEGNFQQFELNH